MALHVLVGPGNEDHAADDGRIAELLVGLDLALHGAVAPDDEDHRARTARERHRGERSVVARAEEREAAGGASPEALARGRIDREHLVRTPSR